ncbi:metallophosphoesterase [Isachenkonia alkalipeptolytica]|uniref:Serine/threonine protein phosphatase n=1 Tax=Isachenkonia alkalipeptolytica TaxID=2565777 RepID=A0AA43XN60_9CLOT|nr:metallophosphoesterase [Isachenkonia alkalipeptolytica]NBG89289.1 serine/threonine protein phosphatase [Isachenkonia alkalipeptolytica]
MSIYAIGDLHLSGDGSKPMDIFGDQWADHKKKIEENWLKKVKVSDGVLIPGDISWAMKFAEAEMDLMWLDQLPGQKFIIRGNHDFWWSSIKKMNRRFKNLFFVQNNCFTYEDAIITGTRGWISPNDRSFTEQDQKIYFREIQRLKRSLFEAAKEKKDGNQKVIVMLHYPPTNELKETTGFIEVLEDFEVDYVVYGHLHGTESFDASHKGEYNGIKYVLASSDYLNFNPVLIIE